MRQEVTTAAFTSETELVHRTSLGRLRRGLRQVDEFRTTFSRPVLLNHIEKREPFPGNGKITRVATDRNGEIHDASVCFFTGIPFFLICPKEQ